MCWNRTFLQLQFYVMASLLMLSNNLIRARKTSSFDLPGSNMEGKCPSVTLKVSGSFMSTNVEMLSWHLSFARQLSQLAVRLTLSPYVKIQLMWCKHDRTHVVVMIHITFEHTHCFLNVQLSVLFWTSLFFLLHVAWHTWLQYIRLRA